MAKIITSVGIEYDEFGIRAAKVLIENNKYNSDYTVESLKEVHGVFDNDDSIVSGIKEIKKKIGIGIHDNNVATTIFGKQIYAVQIKFRKMPENEIKNALKLEIRKNLPFDANNAVVDYQILNKNKSDKEFDYLVSAISNSSLNRHVSNFEKCGIKPSIVDVLPVSVANAFWYSKSDIKNNESYLILHFSPNICTVVIDGLSTPFYTRSIYFSAKEILSAKISDSSDTIGISDVEKSRRLDVLGDELVRSLSFYEKNYGTSIFTGIYILGEYSNFLELHSLLSSKLGLDIETSTILQKLNLRAKLQIGKYDVAIGLAMRGNI